MKTKTFVLVLSFCAFLLNAQDFSTKFYLKDKQGGRDTLELGYSGAATFGLDTQFGELSYDSPVDLSKFCASIIANGSNKELVQIIQNRELTLFSKKQIVPNRQGVYVEQNAVGIMVPFDSLPITISWDKSLFENDERDFSLITDWTIGAWFDAGNCTVKSYLKDVSSVQIPKTTSNYTYDNGVTQHAMYIFYIAFANEENVKVDVKNIQQPEASILVNQKNGVINIDNRSNEQIVSSEIVSVTGRKIEYDRINSQCFDISNQPDGIYIVRIETLENSYCFKIIKN